MSAFQEPGFYSLQGGSQALELHFQGIWHPLLVSIGTRPAHITQTYMHLRHPYQENKNNLFFF